MISYRFCSRRSQKSLSKDIAKFMKELNLPAMGQKALEADEEEAEGTEASDEDDDDEVDEDEEVEEESQVEERVEDVEDANEKSTQASKDTKSTTSKSNLVSCEKFCPEFRYEFMATAIRANTSLV